MAKTPLFFDKFNKDAYDLLDIKKTFDLTYAASLKTKSEDGATVTTEAKIKDGKPEGSLKAEYPLACYGTLEDEITTDKKLTLLFKSKEVRPGFKYELEGVFSPTLVSSLALTGIYGKDQFAAKSGIKTTNPDFASQKLGAISFSSSSSFVYKNLTVGAAAESDGATFTKYDVGALFKSDNRSISVKSADKLTNWTFIFSQQVLPRTTAVASFGLAGPSFADLKAKLSFGFENKVSSDDSLKAAIEVKEGKDGGNQATVALRYTAKLHENARLSHALIVDPLNLAGGSHKAGLKLELGEL